MTYDQWKDPTADTSEQERDEINDWWLQLMQSMEPLGSEFERVWDDNVATLYEP